MTELEQQESIALIDRALAGDYTPFFFIRTFAQKRKVSEYQKECLHIYKQFYKYANKLEKSYLKTAPTLLCEEEPLETLNTIDHLRIVADFYKAEWLICEDIIQEWQNYLFSGHTLKMILIGVRPEEDLIDTRENSNESN